MMLVLVLVSDVISAGYMYWYVRKHHTSRQHKPAEGGSRWSRAVIAMCSLGGFGGTCIHLCLAPLVVPLLSLGMHVACLVFVVKGLLSYMRGTPRFKWQLLGCLDTYTCIMFRSLVMAVIESPAVIAFTTWAFVARRKAPVGTYINRWYYLLGLATSFLHLLLEAWGVMSLRAELGSWAKVWSVLTSLECRDKEVQQQLSIKDRGPKASKPNRASQMAVVIGNLPVH
jgi:hypothetical protein